MFFIPGSLAPRPCYAHCCFLTAEPPRSAHMPLLTSVFEWTAVLNLASRWNFACYRELAIQQLDSITSAVDKIILGRKHNVPSWLHAAYLEVCVREEWLSTEEGERLGLHDVLAIGKTRTAMRASTFLLVSQDQRMSLITDTFHIHRWAKLTKLHSSTPSISYNEPRESGGREGPGYVGVNFGQ
jgi:hypothetical protein